MNYHYIVVEGPIASGKTDLADKLAFFFNCSLIQENPTNNPFLIPYFLNQKLHALPLQLHFLLERAKLLEDIQAEEQKNEAMLISDFLIEKDKIYAPATLDTDELDLYWKIRNQIMPNIIKPDLVILLETSLDRIYHNLSSRSTQRDIYPPNFLDKIFNEYQSFFYVYNEIPTLIANTEELDFINNDEHFNLLIKTMNNLKGKTNYINLSEKI